MHFLNHTFKISIRSIVLFALAVWALTTGIIGIRHDAGPVFCALALLAGAGFAIASCESAIRQNEQTNTAADCVISAHNSNTRPKITGRALK